MTQENLFNRDLSDEVEGIYEKQEFLYDPDKINITTREPTIEQLLRRIKEEAPDLAPYFQRHTEYLER